MLTPGTNFNASSMVILFLISISDLLIVLMETGTSFIFCLCFEAVTIIGEELSGEEIS